MVVQTDMLLPGDLVSVGMSSLGLACGPALTVLSIGPSADGDDRSC